MADSIDIDAMSLFNLRLFFFFCSDLPGHGVDDRQLLKDDAGVMEAAEKYHCNNNAGNIMKNSKFCMCILVLS